MNRCCGARSERIVGGYAAPFFLISALVTDGGAPRGLRMVRPPVKLAEVRGP
jgi:hypothetical protein